MKPKHFAKPVDSIVELTDCALTLHSLFDKGMSIDEVHDFVDAVFDTNMQALYERYKIRRFDD